MDCLHLLSQILHILLTKIIISNSKKIELANNTTIKSSILSICFKKIYKILTLGFVINMNLDYDNVRLKKNSYDKKLAILKEKIKNYRVFKRKKFARSRSGVPLSLLVNMPQSDHPFRNSEDNEKTSNEAVTFKKQYFVKLFIEKLK